MDSPDKYAYGDVFEDAKGEPVFVGHCQDCENAEIHFSEEGSHLEPCRSCVRIWGNSVLSIAFAWREKGDRS